MKQKTRHVVTGIALGIIAAFLVWLMERTTESIAWGLIGGFPISWGIAGYLFGGWEIGK